MDNIHYDPNQYLTMPFTLISTTKKVLNSKVIEQPFAYEVYCPISCKKVKIGVNNSSSELQAMQFNTTSCRWVSLYTNQNMKYLVNKHLPNKKDKKIAKGNNWNIFLQVTDKGNIAILNPYYIDCQNYLSLYTFKKLSKVEKPIDFIFKRINNNSNNNNNICQRSQKLILKNKQIYLYKKQNKTFIGINNNFNENILQLITILNPNNFQQIINICPIKLKQQLKISLDFWLNQLSILIQTQKIGLRQQYYYQYNLDQIYQQINFILNIDQQLRIQMMNSQTNQFYNHYYQFQPRLYSAWNRFASFYNYNNTQYNCAKLADIGFFNRSDMLQDLVYYQYPQIPIPYAEQSIYSSQQQLRNKCFPFARRSRNLPFPNVSLDVCLNSMPYQIVSLKDIKQRQLIHHYLMFVSTDHEISVWNTQVLVIELFKINLIQCEAQVEQNIITTFDQLEKISAQNEEKQENFSALFDEQGSSIEPSKPQEQKQVKPDPTMLEQIISMGYGTMVAKKALVSIKNQSITVAIDAIDSITQEEKKKKSKKVKKQWICLTCTFLNASKNEQCEMCGEIPEIVQEQVERLKQEQQAEKQRKQQEEQQKQKKIKQEQEKTRKKQQIQKQKQKQKQQKLALVLDSEVIYITMIYNEASPIDPFFILVLLWNHRQKKTILNIFRMGLNRKHLLKFYEIQGEIIVSKLDRKILKKQNLLIQINEMIRKFRQKVEWGIKLFEKPNKNDWILVQVSQIQFKEKLSSIKVKGMKFKVIEGEGKVVKEYQIIINDSLIKSKFEIIEQNEINLDQNQQNKVQKQQIIQKQIKKMNRIIKSNQKQKFSIKSGQQFKVNEKTDCIEIEVIEHLPAKIWKNKERINKNISSDCKIQGQVVMSQYIPLTIQCYQGSVFSSKHYSTSILELKNIYISNYPDINFVFKSLSGYSMLIYSATIISVNKRMQKIYPIFSGLIFTANQLSWFYIAKKKFANFKKKDYENWLCTKNSKTQRRQYWQPVSFFQVEGQVEVALDYKRSAKYIFLLPTGVSSNPQGKEISAVKMNFFGVKGRLQSKNKQQSNLYNYKCEGISPCELQLLDNDSNKAVDMKDLIINRSSGINSYNYLLENQQFINSIPLSITTFYSIRLRAGQNIKKLIISSSYIKSINITLNIDNDNNYLQQQEINNFNQLILQHHNFTNFRIQLIIKQLKMQQLIIILLKQEYNFTLIQQLLNKIINFATYQQLIYYTCNQILPNLCQQSIIITQCGFKSFLRLYQKIYCFNQNQTFICLNQCFDKVINYIKQNRNKSYNILRNKYGIEQLVLQPYLFNKDYYKLIHPNYIQQIKPSLMIQPQTKLNNKMYIQHYNDNFHYNTYIDLININLVQKIDLFFPNITQNNLRLKLMIKICYFNQNNQQCQIYYRYFHEQFLVQMCTYAYKENEIYSHSKVNSLSIPKLNLQCRFLKIQVHFLLLTTLINHKYRQPTNPIIIIPLVTYVQPKQQSKGSNLKLQKFLLDNFPNDVKHDLIVQNMPPCRFVEENKHRLYNIYQFPILSDQVVKNESTQRIDRILINIMDQTIVEETIKNIQISKYEYNRKGIDFAYGLIIQISKFMKNMSLNLHLSVQMMLNLFDTFVVYELGPIMNKTIILLIEMYKRMNNRLKGQFIIRIIKIYLQNNIKIKELKLSQKYQINKIIQKLLLFDLPIGLLFYQIKFTNNCLIKSILMRLIYNNIIQKGINHIQIYQNSNQIRNINLYQMIQIIFTNCLWIIDNINNIRQQMLSQSLDIFLILFEKENIQFFQKNRIQAIKIFMKQLNQNQVWKLLFLTLRMKNNKLKIKIHKVFSILIQNITQKLLKNINAMLLQIIRKQQQSIYLQLNKDISNEMWMNNLQTILQYLSLTKRKIFLDKDTALCLLQLPLTPSLWSLALQIIPRQNIILMSIIKNFNPSYYNSLRKQITKFCQPLAGIRSLQSIHINWLELVKQIRMNNKCIFEIFIEQLKISSYGGRQGLTMAFLQDVKNLQIASQFLKLVLENPLNEKNLTINNIHFLILWYFINRTTSKGIAPATDKIKCISDSMLLLFTKITHFSNIIPLCIEEVLKIRKETEIIQSMFEEKRIPSYSALSLADRFSRCTEELLNVFLITDELCNYFAFNISGLNYIMNHMGLQDSKFNVAVQMNIDESFILEEGIITSTKKNQVHASQTQIKQLQDFVQEQFANNIKLVKDLNPENLTTNNTDWTIYKKGNKSKIIFLHMVGDHYYEYPLFITLGKTTQLRSIKIGFPAASYQFNDKLVICPSSVIVEGSIDLINFQPIGQMSFLPDDGYLCNGVKVYVLNLQKIRSLESITQAVKELRCCKVKHLKITVKRPLVTFLEGPYSQLNSKNCENLGCSICFLSVNGDDNDKLPLRLVDSCKQISAKSTLNILNLLMNDSNPTTIKNIANANFFACQFFEKFNIIRKNMKKYTQTMPSIIFSLGNHNHKLGDWIIKQFLQEGNEEIEAKIINQIITCAPQKMYDRINCFLETILKKITHMNKQDEIQGNLLYIKSVHIVQSFCKTLQQCYDIGFEEDSILCCKKIDILNIINIYDKRYSSPEIKSIIRLIISLLYLKKPLKLQENVRDTAMNFIWNNCSESKPYFYTLMASLLVNKQSFKWLQQNQHKKIQQILEHIYKSIDKNNIKILKVQIFLLSQISFHQHKYLRQKKIHLKLYNLLKNIQYTDYDIFQYFLKVISNVVLENHDQQYELAQLLINDVSLLVHRKDPILQKFFVNLLGLQRQVLINIKGLQVSDHKKQTYIPTKLLNRKQQKSLIQKINKNCKFNLLLETKQIKMQHMDQFVNAFNNNSGMLLLIRFQINEKICICGIYNNYKSVRNQQDSYFWQETINYDKKNFMFIMYNQQPIYIKNEPGQQLGILQSSEQDQNMLCFFDNNVQTIKIIYDQGVVNINFNNYYKNIFENGYKGNGKAQFCNLQLWEVKIQHQVNPNDNKISNLLNQSNQAKIPFNYYRYSAIYTFPGRITVGKFMEILGINGDCKYKKNKLEQSVNLASLVQSSVDFIVDIDLYNQQNNDKQQQEFGYIPVMRIFDQFSLLGGVIQVLKLGSQSIKEWKKLERKKCFEHYMQQLKNFIDLPNFFSLFIKNQQSVTFLFEVASGMPDDPNSTRNWQEQQTVSFRFIYKIVADIFKYDKSYTLRNMDNYSDFCQIILQKLSQISKETVRTYKQQEQLEQKQNSQDILPIVAKKKSQQMKQRRKKKGTGYGTDNRNNSKWSASQWIQNRKIVCQEILRVVSIYASFLDCQVPLDDPRIADIIKQSCLLPLIQSALRSGSLLDISKEPQLFKTYLIIVKYLAYNPSTIDCLLSLPSQYKPQQTQSIYTLLDKLNGIAQIFTQCSKGSSSNKVQSNETTESLSLQIQKTYRIIDKALKDLKRNTENLNISQIKNLSIQKAYRLLLGSLRFGYVNLKEATGYKHAHHTQISSNTPSTNKILRLSQQLADLSSSLPCQSTNSIFVRCDKSRIDVIKILVMGSKDTPYSNGAFMFDVYCDDTYPNNPPKMVITTTGQGKIRFNPNLYSCGKVCLSLLGTWRGLASQNWDPKLSTLLQLFISTQGITMSQDVYFNEPGFEGQQGTQQGQKKNQAYSNIVRLGNIRFAMNQQIKNPPKGFEEVIHRHFYIKKKQILQECNKWVQYAEKREASYNGLVNDHNSSWCGQLKATKSKYKQLLLKQIKQLEQRLNKLEQPNLKQKQQQAQFHKEKVHKKIMKSKEVKLTEIDVGYDNMNEKSIDNYEEDVIQDRWSRYIGAMGLEAVKKQSESKILLLGFQTLGLQIAKNLVLSGLKKLTIVDNEERSNYCEHFFMSDIKNKQIKQCMFKIKELNPYMTVEYSEVVPEIKNYNIVISTLDVLQSMKFSEQCRSLNVKFIYAQSCGTVGAYFADFGKEFEIVDTNGQQCFEGFIKNITCQSQAIVTLLDGIKHTYEDGDYIVFSKVQGMQLIQQQMQQKSDIQLFYEKMVNDKPNGINGRIFKIKVINWNSFSIGSTKNYKHYIRNGICKNIKIPKKIQFKSFKQCNSDFEKYIDPNMSIYDFEKMDDNFIIYICMQAYSQFKMNNKRIPNNWDSKDAEQFVKIVQQMLKQSKKSEDEKNIQKYKKFAKNFAYICQANLPTIGALLGGIVAQEAIKAITNKYSPIKQYFTFHLNQMLQQLPENITVQSIKIRHINRQQPFKSLKIVVGKENSEKIQKMNTFVVGAGAIGCELLKNFAMINMAVKGSIVVTDPDHIETSNLTRQFLFRQKHVKKPKSATAAATLLQMNPNLKGHISARLDKISQATEDIYSDKFFHGISIVANALDNVKARKYVDKRCVYNKKPLLQSGTLGPKGHVQVIVPFKTQNYDSQNDPNEELQIPHCTLKMFPQDINHCIQWSRDIFSKQFTLNPKALKKVIDSKDFSTLQGEQRDTVSKMIRNRPINFDDCITIAVKKFYKYFRNNVKQLLHTYPLTMKTKEGKLFWQLPKRPPKQISTIDAQDDITQTFVSSYAVLLAKIYSIPFPKNFRKIEGKNMIIKMAQIIKVKEFIPSEQKSKQIEKMNENEQMNKINKEEKEEKIIQEKQEKNIQIQIQQKIIQVSKEQIKIQLTNDLLELKINPQEFEKDQDSNGHIDLIYAMSNLRAKNYGIDQCKWIQAKLKAGRIMAALSTTTSVIAALQTIQLIKLVIGCENYRNLFANLAIPLMQITEPGPAIKNKIGNTQFSVWQNWEFKAITLNDLLEQILKKYQVEGYNISKSDGQPVYWQAMFKDKQKSEEALLNRSLHQMFGQKHIELNMLMRDAKTKEIYKAVPTVKVNCI